MEVTYKFRKNGRFDKKLHQPAGFLVEVERNGRVVERRHCENKKEAVRLCMRILKNYPQHPDFYDPDDDVWHHWHNGRSHCVARF